MCVCYLDIHTNADTNVDIDIGLGCICVYIYIYSFIHTHVFCSFLNSTYTSGRACGTTTEQSSMSRFLWEAEKLRSRRRVTLVCLDGL